MHEYEHSDNHDTDCKFGDDCNAYKRLIEGGNELKDRCHVTIYKHPPRHRVINVDNNENAEINPFSITD